MSPCAHVLMFFTSPLSSIASAYGFVPATRATSLGLMGRRQGGRCRAPGLSVAQLGTPYPNCLWPLHYFFLFLSSLALLPSFFVFLYFLLFPLIMLASSCTNMPLTARLVWTFIFLAYHTLPLRTWLVSSGEPGTPWGRGGHAPQPRGRRQTIQNTRSRIDFLLAVALASGVVFCQISYFDGRFSPAEKRERG